ncbi:ABC transporter permease [Lentibacillus kapialis]|uniref:Putative hemin transport system permease protein HrtB n=1 Tax=Lentibacillus kapialis TaxID=340214 RepID=A0A917PXM4_9BACI|nr:ABC transporter permease [Lentibacillus kapialis]GGJ99363.1 ABC transporter permease [Lentibacillus kapialis]
MFLAIRELLHTKLRYILIGFIMVLVAMLIFIISGLANGLSADNASSIQDMQADRLVIEKDADQQLTKSILPESALSEVEQAEGVTEAVPLTVHMSGISKEGSEQQHDVAVFGTDLQGMLVPEAIQGKQPADASDVIADESLQQEGMAIGDTLTFSGDNTAYTITGFAENQRFSHTPVIYRDLHHDKMTAVAIQTDGDTGVNLNESYDVLSKDDVLQGIPSYAQEQASLDMMIVFLFVIAAFVLAVFFYVITMQKKSQFGILKALGVETSYIIRNLLFQMVAISILCIGIAMGITYGIKLILPEDMPFMMETTNMVWVSGLLLVVSVLGSLISLFQVVKVDPIQAIEGGE